MILPGNGDTSGGGSNGSPDIPNENACNVNGGIFIDLIGGTGVACAGEPGGPSSIAGGVPNCKLTYSLTNDGTHKYGNITWSDGSYANFNEGAEIDVNTCSWSTSNKNTNDNPPTP